MYSVSLRKEGSSPSVVQRRLVPIQIYMNLIGGHYLQGSDEYIQILSTIHRCAEGWYHEVLCKLLAWHMLVKHLNYGSLFSFATCGNTHR